MISGYLPFLLFLMLLIGFYGAIGAVDGWLRGTATRQVNLNKSMLIGFIGGCVKGIGTLIILTLIALSLWCVAVRVSLQ